MYANNKSNQFPSRDRELKHHVCRLVFSFNIKYIQYFYFYLNFLSCYFFPMIRLLQIFIKSSLCFSYSLQCIFCILKCYQTSDLYLQNTANLHSASPQSLSGFFFKNFDLLMLPNYLAKWRGFFGTF